MRPIPQHIELDREGVPLHSADTAAGGSGYTPAPLPPDETNRLYQLRRTKILDTEGEQFYDDLTFLASTICGTPIALVSLIDEHRQWFKSRIGLQVQETPRDLAFCAHAILEPDRILEVPNAHEDSRFVGNPLVQGGPEIHFYAGAPIVAADGSALGTICVIDNKPHTLNDVQRAALRCLARQASFQLDMRETMKQLEQQTLNDSLTGVRNRRAFDLRLREEWSRHYRLGEWLGLLMIEVNLDYANSHPEGDSFLARAARLVSRKLRPTDYLARYRWDKFAVLLPGKDAMASAWVGEQIRQSVADADWGPARVTVSIGTDAVRRTMELDCNLLVARTNRALHHAKATGGDCVTEFLDWKRE